MIKAAVAATDGGVLPLLYDGRIGNSKSERPHCVDCEAHVLSVHAIAKYGLES